MLIWKMVYVNSAKKLLDDSLSRQLQNLEKKRNLITWDK